MKKLILLLILMPCVAFGATINPAKLVVGKYYYVKGFRFNSEITRNKLVSKNANNYVFFRLGWLFCTYKAIDIKNILGAAK